MIDENIDTNHDGGQDPSSEPEVVFEPFVPPTENSDDNTDRGNSGADDNNNADPTPESPSGGGDVDSGQSPENSGGDKSSPSADAQSPYENVLKDLGYDSVENLVKSHNELKEQANKPAAPVEEADEFVKSYKAFIDKGGDKNVFMKAYSVDPSTLDAKDALRQKYLLDHPHIDASKAERMFEIKYRKDYEFDEDLVDDDEKELKELELEVAKTEAIKQLTEEREKMLSVPESKNQDQGGPSQEEVQKYVEQFHEMRQDSMKDFNSVEVMIDDNKENRFVYTVSDDTKAKVNGLLSIPFVEPTHENFMESVTAKIFLDEKGDWDLGKAKEILTFIADRQNYLKEFAKHAMAKGEEAYITGKTKPTGDSRDDHFRDGSGDGEPEVVITKRPW